MKRKQSESLELGRSSEPALMILISLADGPKHGYAMTADIEALAGMRPGPGTLYGAVTRLEERGLIERVDTGDRRNPYRLTGPGCRACAHGSRHWRRSRVSEDGDWRTR